jgi:RNA exonuclease 4
MAGALVLSSNWKKLQHQLKRSSESAKPKSKRQTNGIAKRKRIAANLKSTSQVVHEMSALTEAPGDGKSTETIAILADELDIPAADLAEAFGLEKKDNSVLSKDCVNGGLNCDSEVGQYIAIDCEMVGVGGEADRSALARVSVVNYHGIQVYDSFVRPKEFVTDWRTHVSGVTPKSMATARSFETVQQDIANLLQGRVLIGHAVRNDLDAMMLGHPKKDIRDTSRFSGFRKYSAGRTPSLKKLAQEVLGIKIQDGEHSSIEDARATMLIFKRHKAAIDMEHVKKFPTAAPKGLRSKANKKK